MSRVYGGNERLGAVTGVDADAIVSASSSRVSLAVNTKDGADEFTPAAARGLAALLNAAADEVERREREGRSR